MLKNVKTAKILSNSDKDMHQSIWIIPLMSNTQGLGLRKTPRGNPSYIFQSRFNGKSIRISIGSPKVWSIGDAQQKAREFQRQIDQGQDPRQIRAKLQAKQQRDQTEKKLKSATFGEVFSDGTDKLTPNLPVFSQ